MNIVPDIVKLITAFDVAIVYIERFKEMTNNATEQTAGSLEFRTKASSAKQVLELMNDGDNITPVALDQLAVSSIVKAYSVTDGWLAYDKEDSEMLERLKYLSNKRLTLVLTIFRNRLAELTLMNEEKDLTFRLSGTPPVETPAEDTRVSDFYDRVQTAQYVRVPMVFDDVDYWWRITDSKKQPNGIIIGLTRTTQGGENKFCDHFVHLSDFDKMVLSEHDPAKTEVDLCPEKDIETRLRENKWVWVLDKDSSRSGKWWAIDGIRTGGVRLPSKELHLSRVTGLDGSKLKISIDVNRFDLDKLKLSARPTLAETHRIVASMICAKYIKMFGEGEWMYVEGVDVTEMPDRSGNNFIKFGVVTVQGIRSSIETTDVDLYYSNALMSVEKPEQLEIAEGEKLRDFLDKAGSNKYLTVTQLDDGKAVTVTYVIEGVEHYPVEVKDSILKLSFLDSIADNGFIRKRVDTIVFDRTNTYSFSNEPPSV